LQPESVLHNALETEELDALARIHQLIQKEFGYTPVMACEIEFYLHGLESNSYPQAILNDLLLACQNQGVTCSEIIKERGYDQYETALLPTADVVGMARQTMRLKEVLLNEGSKLGVRADFSAKPQPDQPGCGLHVHVHLEDRHNRNLFVRDEDQYSMQMLHSVAGLLELMPASMLVFAPHSDSYARFVSGQNAPLTVCWGPNNRTVAIRLPTKPLNNKHLEHRVAGSDADPALVMAVIVAGIHYGLKNTLYPPEPVFGDASLPMYKTPSLPRTLSESIELMSKSRLMEAYLGEKLYTAFMQRTLYPEAF
jgi:glutamine synthetase